MSWYDYQLIKRLDNAYSFLRIRIICMPGCEHKRTEFLMRRDGVDYMRCMDCDHVFEAEDLDVASPYDDEDEPRQKRAS